MNVSGTQQVSRSQQVSRVLALVALCVLSGGTVAVAAAAPCPGNPEAIGVSRVLTLNAEEIPRLGLMQYRRSLPLAEREVVLTFDDGPIAPYTDRVLDILSQHCVKATFFLVGRHTAANPEAARRVYLAGHTIGNHSQNHILHFSAIAEARAEREFASSAAIIRAAIGAPDGLAPFVRIPGLGRTRAVEKYMQARSQVVWSADTVADDWTHISSKEVLKRALARLERKGRGVLLLHDIQPRTVSMLPALLTELKRRQFRIVQVVAQGAANAPAEPPADGAGAVRVAAAPAAVLADGEPAAETTTGSVTKPVATTPQSVPLPPRRRIRTPRRVKTAGLAPEQQSSVLDDVYQRIMSR
jgi:peptidoglycan/xylan/chitin deacetylase (PgdA/CDA1 family)